MSRKYRVEEKHAYHHIRIGNTGSIVAGVVIGILLVILVDLVGAVVRYL